MMYAPEKILLLKFLKGFGCWSMTDMFVQLRRPAAAFTAAVKMCPVLLRAACLGL